MKTIKTLAQLQEAMKSGYTPKWSDGWKMVNAEAPTLRVSVRVASSSWFSTAYIQAQAKKNNSLDAERA